jgi:hypothetical protein
LKIRDLGGKIGDIEIKKPSSKSISKAWVLISILYRIGYWGVLAVFTVMAYVATTSEYGYPEYPIVVAVAVIVGDLLLIFIIKQYKSQTKDL